MLDHHLSQLSLDTPITTTAKHYWIPSTSTCYSCNRRPSFVHTSFSVTLTTTRVRSSRTITRTSFVNQPNPKVSLRPPLSHYPSPYGVSGPSRTRNAQFGLSSVLFYFGRAIPQSYRRRPRTMTPHPKSSRKIPRGVKEGQNQP